MSYQRAWNSYRQTSLQTSSPGQLVLMLYEGALRFLDRALKGFAAEDPLEFNATISNNLLRAQNIINELNNTLDLERGGQLAMTLRGLYGYMDDLLTASNIRKSPDGIHETIRRLSVLRDAWRDMLQQAAAPHSAGNSPTSLCACG